MILWYFLDKIFLCTSFKQRTSKVFSCLFKNLKNPLALQCELILLISTLFRLTLFNENQNYSKASIDKNLQLFSIIVSIFNFERHL